MARKRKASAACMGRMRTPGLHGAAKKAHEKRLRQVCAPGRPQVGTPWALPRPLAPGETLLDRRQAMTREQLLAEANMRRRLAAYRQAHPVAVRRRRKAKKAAVKATVRRRKGRPVNSLHAYKVVTRSGEGSLAHGGSKSAVCADARRARRLGHVGAKVLSKKTGRGVTCRPRKKKE